MIGVPCSLFQKCSSFMEASLRLAQAWMIGGIVYRIPRSVLLSGSTDSWLDAFACSPMPALQIPRKFMPILDPVPPCSTSEALDVVLDAEVMGDWWQSFVPGRKRTGDYTPTIDTSPQAVFTPLDPPPSPSSTSSWESGASSSSSRFSSSRTQPVGPPPAHFGLWPCRRGHYPSLRRRTVSNGQLSRGRGIR